MRKLRSIALRQHARAVDAIFETWDRGHEPDSRQWGRLDAARDTFEAVRPHGWEDAEAAYVKDHSLAADAARGDYRRAASALQHQTRLRENERIAAQFVERWRKLDRASQDQYQAGDMSGYNATRSAMGDMAKSLQRDPQLESILANRKLELGIQFESGRRLGAELAFTHGIDLGRGRGIGL
jgi:hypothetical protein